MACLVEVSEPVQSDATKQVSATRTLVAARDVTRELRLFVCDCAERTLTRERGQGREPDARSWAAIEVARRHADGKATDNELAAARYAQWDWQRQHLAELLDPLFAEVGT